jgi:hypothetical protein
VFVLFFYYLFPNSTNTELEEKDSRKTELEEKDITKTVQTQS